MNLIQLYLLCYTLSTNYQGFLFVFIMIAFVQIYVKIYETKLGGINIKKLNSRQQQALNTKLRITESAMELFQNTEYDSVKISDICTKAGVSIGTFYHYFESKDKITIAGYDIIDNMIIEYYSTKTFQTTIDSIIWLNQSVAHTIMSLGLYFISNCYRQLLVDSSNYTISPDRTYHKELNRLLASALAKGEIEEIDTAELSEYINKTARGNIFDWCLKHGSFDLEEAMTHDISNILVLHQIP